MSSRCQYPDLHTSLPPKETPEDIKKKVFIAGFFSSYRNIQTPEHIMQWLIKYHFGTIWEAGNQWGMLQLETELVRELTQHFEEKPEDEKRISNRYRRSAKARHL